MPEGYALTWEGLFSRMEQPAFIVQDGHIIYHNGAAGKLLCGVKNWILPSTGKMGLIFFWPHRGTVMNRIIFWRGRPRQSGGPPMIFTTRKMFSFPI